MQKKEMICIVCPLGCQLEVAEDSRAEKGYKVDGNRCKRGTEYGIKEMSDPTRVVTSTVRLKGAYLRRLPVRSDGPVPKKLVFECMKRIAEAEVQAPVRMGDVIIENILDTGINIIASKSMQPLQPLTAISP